MLLALDTFAVELEPCVCFVLGILVCELESSSVLTVSLELPDLLDDCMPDCAGPGICCCEAVEEASLENSSESFAVIFSHTF